MNYLLISENKYYCIIIGTSYMVAHSHTYIWNRNFPKLPDLFPQQDVVTLEIYLKDIAGLLVIPTQLSLHNYSIILNGGTCLCDWKFFLNKWRGKVHMQNKSYGSWAKEYILGKIEAWFIDNKSMLSYQTLSRSCSHNASCNSW